VGALEVSAVGAMTQRQPMMHRTWEQICEATNTDTYEVHFQRDAYSNATDTLVSQLGAGDVALKDGGNPFPAILIADGQTRVVNVAGGAQNTPIRYAYTVTYAAGTVTVTFPNLAGAVNLHVGVNADPANISSAPGQNAPVTLTPGANAFTVPTTGEGAVYLFIHIAGGMSWFGDYHLVNPADPYVLVSHVEGAETCVDGDYADTDIADGAPVVTALALADFTVIVTDANGVEVTDLANLVPGTCTVTLYYDGTGVDSMDIVVKSGETAHADFTNVAVQGVDLPVQYDADSHDGPKSLTTHTTDNKGALSLSDPYAPRGAREAC
jgi:hypothetical protein